MTTHSKLIRLALLVAGLLVVGGIAVAVAADDGSSSSDPRRDTTPVAAVSDGLSSHYALLRRPATERDALPDFPGDEGRPAYGANPALARAVGDSGYYAVPGRDSICLLTSVGGGVCGTTWKAPTILTSRTCKSPAGTFNLTALFPDGIDEVTIAAGDGTSRTVAIELNGLTVDLPDEDGAQTLSWSGRGGEGEAALPVPAAGDHCPE
jgi:hypothetical protein